MPYQTTTIRINSRVWKEIRDLAKQKRRTLQGEVEIALLIHIGGQGQKKQVLLEEVASIGGLENPKLKLVNVKAKP
jgi:hypothetical protein